MKEFTKKVLIPENNGSKVENFTKTKAKFIQIKIVVQLSVSLQTNIEVFNIIFAIHFDAAMHAFIPIMQQLIIVKMILKIKAGWGLGSTWRDILVIMQLDYILMERGVSV